LTAAVESTILVPGGAMTSAYQKFRPCVLHVVTRDSEGNEHSGTGFHLGSGIVATARHVVEEMNEVTLHGPYQDPLVPSRIIYPRDQLVDLALLVTPFDLTYYMEKVTLAGASRTKTDVLPLGVEWDDFVDDSLVLHDCLVMGYPPIPLGFPTLVAVRAQVNAVVDQYPLAGSHPPPCYILSGIPRGGFSGAPMLVERGEESFVLGVITASFVKDHAAPESGFMAAVTIESLLALLHDNGIYPAGNEWAVRAFASEPEGQDPGASLPPRTETG